MEDWEHNRAYIGPQYAAWFIGGRPQISWHMADYLHHLLNKHGIDRVGVTGSLSLSILVALAYGETINEVNAFASHTPLNRISGWNWMIEDSPGMEKNIPYAHFDIAFKNKMYLWDGATPFFENEAIFCDLPFSHECVQLKLESLTDWSHKLILLGFLQEHEGPDDVFEYFKNDNHYQLHKKHFPVENVEYGKKLDYELAVFEKE